MKNQLINLIKQQINIQSTSFADFMQMALYSKKLGYYTNPKISIGYDFITAPHISSLFSKTLAKSISNYLTSSQNIIEFGAGSGIMAADILLFLESNNIIINNYYIIEISDTLKNIQKETFRQKAPELLNKITWLDTMPSDFSGVIVANELFDALATERFIIKNKKINQLNVKYADDFFYTAGNEINVKLPYPIEDYPENYISEINPNASDFLNKICKKLDQGAIFIIDYGYENYEYYHPQRTQGTLKCFYQHRHHDNPFINIGTQDITSHIDFTSFAQIAKDNNLSIETFCTQAKFLLSNGITEIASSMNLNDSKTRLQVSQEIQKLTLPAQMGEILKFMVIKS